MKKIMREKRAWIRIVEAFIAIILITSILIFLYSRTIEKPRRAEEIYKLQKTILDEIAADQGLRQAVLDGKPEDIKDIKDFVRERVRSGFTFEIKICEVEDICVLDEYREEVFSSEGIISATLEKYEPKKLKIFMWKGE